MKKRLIAKIFQVFSLMILMFPVCLSYVETEIVFDRQMVWNEKKSDGSDSDVVIVQSSEQFSKEVINNQRPVLIRISSQKNTTLKTQFQILAEQTPSVDFVFMNLSTSGELIRAIMMKAQVSQISIPFFLFFKGGSLIHIRSYDTEKMGETKIKQSRELKLREIESDLKRLIKKRFFEQPLMKKLKSKPKSKPTLPKAVKPKKVEPEGFWQKIQKWKNWIFG
jgi:hypothetical protein